MNKVKNILIGLILIFLFLNTIQRKLDFIHLPMLQGDVPKPDTPVFNAKNWFERKFQDDLEKFSVYNFGFSSAYIRLNNQINYSLFNKASANGAVIGKENYLYELNYISAYYGHDFIGEKKIIENIKKLKVIQDSLLKHNKHLLLVFCPGKASFFPEYIPDQLRYKETNKTNMRYYIKYAEQFNVEHIDLYDWFLENKNTSKYPLYTKYGIHWSEYGEYFFIKNLNEIIKEKFKLPQPEISIDRIEKSVKPIGRDNDIGGALNLLFRFKHDTMYYPKLKIDKRPGLLPNALVISDSYYWGMIDKNWNNILFDHNSFWYYNTLAYNNKNFDVKQVASLNLADEINKHDIFIMMATEATIYSFGWGAIDQFYNYVNGANKNKYSKPENYHKRIAQWKKYIYSDKKWMKDSENRAKRMKVSLDSSVTLDAIYMTELGY